LPRLYFIRFYGTLKKAEITKSFFFVVFERDIKVQVLKGCKNELGWAWVPSWLTGDKAASAQPRIPT